MPQYSPIQRGLAGYARFAQGHRLLIGFIALALTATFAAFIPRVTFDNTPDSFFLRDDPTLEVYGHFKDLFESDEYSLIVVDAPQQWEPGRMEQLRRLEHDLARLPHVLRVTGITNVRHIEGDDFALDVGQFLPEGLNANELAAKRREALGHPHYSGLYVSEDGRVFGIVVETEIIEGDIEYKRELADSIRDLLDQDPYAAWNPRIVGAPILDADVREIVDRESALFGAITFALVGFGFLLVFRSWLGVALPLGIASGAIVIAFGIMGLIGAPVTILTPIVPSFLLSVGIGSCVFLLTEIYSRAVSSKPASEVVAGAFRSAGVPCIMASSTTAAALLAFSSSKIKPVMDVGIVMGLGLLAALVLTLLLVPVAFSWQGGLKPSPARARMIGARVHLLERICDLVLARPKRVLAGFACVLLIAAAGLILLRADYHYLGTFKEDTRIRQDYAAADAALAASAAIEVLIEAPEVDAFKEPDALRALDELTRAIEQTDWMPVETYSLADVVKEINQAVHEGDPNAYRIPDTRAAVAQMLLLFESSGHDELTRLTVPDYDVARLTVRVPNLSDDAYRPLVAAIEDEAARLFGPELGDFHVVVTGLVPMWMQISSYLADSQIKSFLISFAVITLVMIAMFRSLSLGLLMSSVNATVIGLVLGVMGLAGIRLDPYTILIAAIALGILDDDTIHFVKHIQSGLERGEPVADAIRGAYRSAGQAMFYTTAVLACSFSAYALSEVASLAKFGLLVGLTILLGLIIEFLLTPSVVLVLAQAGWLPRRSDRPARAAALLRQGGPAALVLLLVLSPGLAKARGALGDLDYDLKPVLGGHYASGSADLDNESHLVGGTAYLEGEVATGDVSGFLESNLQVTDFINDREVRPEHVVRQAYFDVIGDNFDLRVGRQLIIWGRADRFNPTDVLTPADFRFLTVEDQGQRFGAIAASGRWFINDTWSLYGALLPAFRPSILPEGFLPSGVSADDADAFEPFDEPGFALKLERIGFAADGSVSLVRSHFPLPALTARPDGTLAFINSEFFMLGADFAATTDVWGFRGELAYVDFREEDRFPAETGPQDYLYAVLGVERAVFETSNLIVQGLFRHVFDFEPSSASPPGLAELAEVNDAIYGQFDETEPGLNASLTSRFLNDTLRTEVGGAVFFGERSAALRAKASYQITDRATVAGMLNVFAGPEESIFGAIEDSSRLFVELRYAL